MADAPPRPTFWMHKLHVKIAPPFDPDVLDVVTDTLAANRARRTREVNQQARLAVVPDVSAG